MAFDETWVLTRLASGRALGNRTARDTRKFNTRALWASQNGGDSQPAHSLTRGNSARSSIPAAIPLR